MSLLMYLNCEFLGHSTNSSAGPLLRLRIRCWFYSSSDSVSCVVAFSLLWCCLRRFLARHLCWMNCPPDPYYIWPPNYPTHFPCHQFWHLHGHRNPAHYYQRSVSFFVGRARHHRSEAVCSMNSPCYGQWLCPSLYVAGHHTSRTNCSTDPVETDHRPESPMVPSSVLPLGS